jgi:hypothetical protein
VKNTILHITGGLPAISYAIGKILSNRFSFNELENADLLAELQRKPAQGS